MKIFSLFGEVLVEDEKAKKSLDEIDKKGESVGNRFVSMIGAAAKLGAGIAAGAGLAAGAIGMLTGKVLETTLEITKFSQVTGMSTDSFQKWDYAMKTIGFSMEQASGDMAALAEKAMDAANGVGEGAELFGMLGVVVTDTSGKLKSQEQIFNETITALQGMEDVTKRNAIASAMLSTTGEELVPILNMTGEELKKLQDRATVISEEDLQKAAEFRARWDQIKATASGLVTEFGVKLLPMLQKVLNWFLEYMPQIKAVSKVVFDAIQTGISLVVEWISKLKGWLDDWRNSNESALSGIWRDFQKYLGSLLEYGKFIFNTVKDIIMQVMSTIAPFIQEKLAAILDFWDENGAQIIQAVQNIFNFIMNTIEYIMPYVTDIIKVSLDIIMGVFDAALDIIMGLIKVFVGLFTGDWEKMGEGLLQIWDGLWKAIVTVLEGARDLLGIALGLVVDLIEEGFTWLGKKAVEWGKNIIQGLIDGIVNMAGKAKDAALNMANGVKDAITGFFKISSPSRLMFDQGKFIAQGLADGIYKNKEEAIRAAEQMATQVARSFDQLGNAIISSLKSRYAEQERIELDSIRGTTEHIRSATNQRIAEYNREYAARLRTLDIQTNEELEQLQDQIEGIEDKTRDEERQLDQQKWNTQLAAKQKELDEAESAEKRAQISKELNQMILDRERQRILEGRQLQIESLREEMDRVREQAELKKEELEKELEQKKTHTEDVAQMQLAHWQEQEEKIKEHYANLLESESLQSEARKIILNESNQEMIELLEEYNPKWQDAGQSFGESLLEGLNSTRESIKSAVHNILSLVNSVGGKQQKNTSDDPPPPPPTPTQDDGDDGGFDRGNELEYLRRVAKQSEGARKWAEKQAEKYGFPGLEEGGEVTDGGMVLVGETAPEILNLPEGARVTPLDKLDGGDIVLNINNPKIFSMRDVNEMGESLIQFLRKKGLIP